MGESFYAVLGVGTDADTEAIERAYRDRVKECHPDVADTPDARDQFKRLTVARDTLVDSDERVRYDRLGHQRYVRKHVGSGLFDAASPPGEKTGSKQTEAAETGGGGTADTAPASTGFTDAATESAATDGWARKWGAGSTAAAGAGGGRSHGTPAGGSDIYGTRSSTRTDDRGWSVLSALAEAVGTLGPWLIVYLLVVATAGATGWLVAGAVTVSSLFVAVCLCVIVCIALAATVLHLVAKLA